MKTINTITLILSATLILHFNAISGSFNSSPADISVFAPVTPEEADFTDGVPVADATMINLAPVTPAEADFTDEAPEAALNLSSVAPLTPAEADFNDTVDMNAGISALAPVTPAEADFE
ncbi:MAG: hypothetical protein NTU98_08505 [Bacteroidetes bacterium]|nr:hypothetical protein [Bacteroidota bacterium]